MPKIISIPSRKIEAEFPDSMPDEEIKSILQAKYPRTGDDVAYDLSQFKNIADTRDFIASLPDDEYVMLNNYTADKKLSWGEMAGIASDAIGTIVGDVVKGAGKAVTKAGDGVAESALRGVAAGTVDIVNLGHKLITPNERIPTFEEFMQTPRTQLGYAYGPAPSVTQVQPTEQDYKTLIDQQRAMELQSLDIADISEKLIQGAPVPEVARGASYLDAVTLAGLAKSVARSGIKSIYKAAAKQPLKAAGAVAPDVAAKGIPTMGVVSGELGESVIPKNMMRAEQFATKVGEGARKAGLTGVEYGFKGIEKTADLGAGIIKVAERLGLENAALRGSLGGALGYQEGGTQGAILGTIGGAIIPKAIKKTFQFTSGAADFIGAAAKVGKTGASRTGIFEKMAQAANISPEARKIAEKLLFTQPFVQYAGDVAGQATKNALLGAGVGAGLGYLADGEQGAAAGAGAGAAIGGLGGAWDASYDAMKSIAGRSTARSQRNAAGDIKSFVNDIADDQARADYGEIMNRAIQVAGPERAADMLDSLRLAESMGATVKTVPLSERGKAFNEFDYATNTITINPDRMNAGSVQHEVFHQLFNVGVRGELQKALSDIYLPKKDADGNIIQNGLFTDKEFAKKAAELAEKYKNNEKGYKNALEQASVLDNPAGFSPEAVDNAREFVIDEMTAAYTEKFMGRSRTGVFNPDRLPMWHRQILENIDDKILNRINDKMFADRSVKDPTAFFTDAEGKPVRVPQLDNVLNRAFKSKLGRDRSVVGKPREVIAPKNPRELGSWAAATFGATRDVLDPTGQRPLTEQERKVITAADFDAAKALYQSLPDEDKKTVRVTKKSGVPTDINSKGARIEITSQTPSNVFESFLQVAKDRGMGNQQLANMRQLYASMVMDDGPTFDTVNNPVYKYNPKTGKMTPGVRPASRQEVYPTAITVNSAGGFNVEYIDLSRVKANAQKILDNPKYKGVWNGINDFMTDFGASLRNLSKGEDAAIPSAELLGKGNAKVGAMKRDLIAEAMNVTLPKRLEEKGYINQPTIDPLTLATKEGKDRRTEGSAFRDFRIERLTDVTPTNNRLKMVKENAYDIFVQRYQPDAFTPESLPNGEAYTNPDGYRILNKTGSKLFRTYDDTGKLIGVAESKEKAVKKAMDEATKRMTKEMAVLPPEVSTTLEPSVRFQPSEGVPIVGKEGDSETIPLYQKKENGKLLFERDGTPKVVNYNYDLLNLDQLKRFKGPVEDKTLVSESQFDYDVGPKAIKAINDAIKSGAVDSLVNKTVRETLAMMEDPSIVAGKGWYSRMRVALKKVYGDFSETFAQLLGATSAQTPVDQNFLQAVEAAEMIKSGAYDNNRKQYLVMRQSMADGTIKQVIKDRGLIPKISIQIQKLQETLPKLTKKAERESLAADIKSLSKLVDIPEDKWTNANMSDIFMLGEDIIPRRNNGRKYNANSKQVLAVIGGDWLRVVDAPKTPNFAGNLTGRTLQATIDVWAARFMRRMIYGGTDAPWRIQYDAEVGVTNKDFAFSQIVLERAAKKLNMNPDDLQAVLWFGEKDIYSKKNWTSAEGKKKASFDEMFNLFFPANEKPRTFSEVRDMLDKKKK